MEHPAVIRKYWYSIDWDVETLWALDLPVEIVDLDRLIWHLDVPIWADRGRPYSVTPRQVMDAPAQFHVEAARIAAADLAYPLEVFENKGRLMILDGVHRMARAVQLGHESLNVRFAPASAVTRLDATVSRKST